MQRLFQFCLVLVFSCILVAAQTAQEKEQSQNPQQREKPAGPTDDQKDVDPLALRVLKAVTDPVHTAKTYSFKTRAMRENLGTNGQIVTAFTTADFYVQRPNKLRVNFKGEGRNVQLFYDGAQAVLYTPSAKLYSRVEAPNTLDGVLERLEQRGLRMPVKNLLVSNPYQSLAPDVTTGYVLGRVDMYGQIVHQLAFTEPGAEWQMWVTGGENPRIQKVHIVDLELPHEPRTVIEFSDWNLNPTIAADMFTFKAPPDAHEIPLLEFPRQD